MKALKIGVIGAGHMGSHHVRNLSEEKRFDLVGIYDSNSEQARIVAEKYDVTAFETADDLLKNIEAVVIAVPSSLHKEVALKAAEYNVHALIEKPLATSSEDAEFISRTFEERNLLLAVGHIERFNPVFRELKKRKIHYDLRAYNDLRPDSSGKPVQIYDRCLSACIPLVAKKSKGGGV